MYVLYIFCRACNCDNADDVWRRDGGVISQKSDLPLRSLKVFPIPNSKMALTAGKIYCADKPFGEQKYLLKITLSLPRTTTGNFLAPCCV